MAPWTAKERSPVGKKILFHCIFLTASLALGLAGAELVVRLTEKAPVHAARAGNDPGEQNPLLPDPEIGFRLSPEAKGVNSRGLYDAEIPQTKTPGIPRVLVLGDSVTIWCDWVNTSPDTFLARLRRRLEGRVELVNAAVSGYTIHQERLQLERQLDLDPDFVLLQYTLNDNAKFLHQFDPERHILLTEEARRVYVESTTGPLGWLAEHSTLALRVRFAWHQWTNGGKQYPWEKYPGFPQAWRDESWALVEDELGKIVELSAGARVMVLVVPFGPQFEGDFLAKERDYVTFPQTRMREIGARKGVEVIDPLPAFEGNGGANLFYDLVHMTAEGHRLVAEALAPKLEAFSTAPTSPALDLR